MGNYTNNHKTRRIYTRLVLVNKRNHEAPEERVTRTKTNLMSSNDSSSSQTKVIIVKSCKSNDNSPYTPVTGHLVMPAKTTAQISKSERANNSCRILEKDMRQPRIEKIGRGEKKDFWNIPRNKKNVINLSNLSNLRNTVQIIKIADYYNHYMKVSHRSISAK